MRLSKQEIKELKNEPFITTHDYAKLMNLSQATVRRNCVEGKIDGAKKASSGSWRIANPLFTYGA